MKLLKCLIVFLLVFLSGCGVQFDTDLGYYRTPRISAKMVHKGENNGEEYKSRQSGSFGMNSRYAVSEELLPMVGE